MSDKSRNGEDRKQRGKESVMNLFNLFAAKSNPETLEQRFRGHLQVAFAGLDGALGLDYVEELTFADVVRWFVANRPMGDTPLRGALVRRTDIRGSQVIWCFLDSADVPQLGPDRKLLGRKAIVSRFDPELEEWFNGRDLLIFT